MVGFIGSMPAPGDVPALKALIDHTGDEKPVALGLNIWEADHGF